MSQRASESSDYIVRMRGELGGAIQRQWWEQEGAEEGEGETWYLAYQDYLFRFLLHMTGDPDEARDCVQETVLHALRGFDAFRGEATLQSWLTRIAMNVVLSRRRRQRYVTVDDQFLEQMLQASKVPDPSPEEIARRHRIYEQIGEAMAQLPPKYRVVMWLHHCEGYRAREVATLLNLSISAVKSRLYRSRLAIKQQLQAIA